MLVIKFEQTGLYAAARECARWLKQRGYSHGPVNPGLPVAVEYGECKVGDWRGMSNAEKAAALGTMHGDLVSGPITLTLQNALHERQVPVMDERLAATA